MRVQLLGEASPHQRFLARLPLTRGILDASWRSFIFDCAAASRWWASCRSWAGEPARSSTPGGSPGSRGVKPYTSSNGVFRNDSLSVVLIQNAIFGNKFPNARCPFNTSAATKGPAKSKPIFW